MTHRNDEKHFERLMLDVKNALSAARVLRGTGDPFEGQPLLSAGGAILVGALTARLRPDVVHKNAWAQEVFTRLSPEYGHLLACDLPDLLGMLRSERHTERTSALIRQIDIWSAQVASGDGEAEYLSDVAEKIGSLLLALTLSESPFEVSSADVGKWALQLYESGLRLGGESFEAAWENDSLHVRKAAFAELAVMASTAALHARGEIPFQQIGASEQLLIRLSPTSSAGHHLVAWISAKGRQPRLVSPITMLLSLRSHGGVSGSVGAEDALCRLDRYCDGLVNALSEAA